MEKITTQQNDHLLDLLDGKLSGAEANQLKKQLEQSPALRQRLEELHMVNTLLSERSSVITPSLHFTDTVMNNLDRQPALSIAISPRNGLLLLCGILVAMVTSLLLLASGTFDKLDGSVPLETLNLPKQLVMVSVDSIPFSGKSIMKILIIVNLVLAFIVLDRSVLKPWFERKHKVQNFS